LDFLGSINRLIEKNKFQQANQELDLVIELNDHRKEEALWLKSVCLIKLKRNAEAKVVLNQIVLIDRNYKSQALRVLNNLK
jgi:thioredoxin-like negative regulator of GroEL